MSQYDDIVEFLFVMVQISVSKVEGVMSAVITILIQIALAVFLYKQWEYLMFNCDDNGHDYDLDVPVTSPVEHCNMGSVTGTPIDRRTSGTSASSDIIGS